ncbi:hypothetical protein [Brevundimonas sp.]|uniref:hypothetical protein n=1 Tax=Brevundimonas sp. TaxID=1871086 RepID=UPI00289A1A4F|nr:hypothetical protein [Brevundimonas sp.]
MTDLGVWTDNFSGSVVKLCVIPTTPSGYDCENNTAYFNVTLGDGPAYVFRQEGTGPFIPVSGVDARLTFNGGVWTLTTHDGTTATYGWQAVGSPYSGPAPEGFDQDAVGAIQSLTRPNGETLSFHYRTAYGCCGKTLASVFSNFGYQVYFEYFNDASARMSRAVVLNNAEAYCDPGVPTCVLSGAWPQLTFEENGAESAVTDALGRTTRYFRSKSPSNRPVDRLTGIRRPDRPNGLSVSLTYRGGPSNRPYAYRTVATIDHGNGAWTYSGGSPTFTVTDPLGNVSTYEIARTGGLGGNALVTTSQNFRRIVDAVGNETLFTYDHIPDFGPRLTSVRMPEGDKVAL